MKCEAGYTKSEDGRMAESHFFKEKLVFKEGTQTLKCLCDKSFKVDMFIENGQEKFQSELIK